MDAETNKRPKQRLSPPPSYISPARLRDYNRLLRKLGTSQDAISALPQTSSHINRIAKKLNLSRSDIIEHLAASSDEEVHKWLQVYNRTDIPDDLRDLFPYELYCAVSGMSPNRLLEHIVSMIVRLNAQVSTAIAAVHHPEVVEATVGYALTQEGIQDRNTLHKAVGFTPTPKSAQTNINISAAASAAATAQAQSAIITAPPPELMIRTLVDRFNDARGLKGAGASAPQLQAENPHEYAPKDVDQDEREPISVMSPAQTLARKMYEREMEHEE